MSASSTTPSLVRQKHKTNVTDLQGASFSRLDVHPAVPFGVFVHRTLSFFAHRACLDFCARRRVSRSRAITYLFFTRLFCDREIQQVPVLPALNRAAPPCAGWVSASRYRASARSSCSSSPGPSPRGQLKQGSSESALAPSDRGRTQQSEDGNGSVPRPEAQELHNFGAKPAANFSANDDEAASTERPTSKCTLAAREKQI